jgi:hypothetical protein
MDFTDDPAFVFGDLVLLTDRYTNVLVNEPDPKEELFDSPERFTMKDRLEDEKSRSIKHMDLMK